MKLLLALLVLAAWVGLTAVAAWAVPERHDPNAKPDLSVDPHWQLRTPPNPVHYDRVPRGTRATTTTSVAEERSGAAARLKGARPVPPRPPPTRIYGAGVEQWRSLVAQYPWPVETMLAIMRCESGGNPLARNRSGASGLFQLLPGPPGWQDPATNVRLAYTLKYVPSGLRPWDASRSCWG